MSIPIIRNGANGISLFIPCFLPKITKDKPTTAPIQKASVKPAKACDKPSIQPKPIANLASPRPIQAPPDTSQKSAKGVGIDTDDQKESTFAFSG